MTIRRLRLIAFLGLLLLIAASVAVTFAALQMQHDDALVINLAGRQRMLIQKMALEVLGTQIGTNRVYREDLHNTAHAYFEATLNALIAGGPAPYGQVSDLPQQVTVTLPPTRSPQILAQLQAVRANWEEMHAAIDAVLDSDPQSTAFAGAVATVERLSPVMLSQMDEAVRLYEAEAERKVALAQDLQIGFLAAAVALVMAILALTARWVLAPIARLGNAARRIGEGDLATAVSVTGPGEISRLARSFDDMRQSLAASRAELEAWAERLDRRVRQRTDQLSALHDITALIGGSPDIDAMLKVAVDKASEVMEVEVAAVMLLDAEAGELRLAAHRGLSERFEREVERIKLGAGLSGRAAASGEPVVVSNVADDPRLAHSVVREEGWRAFASVPLLSRGQVLGVLNVATRQERTFPAEEVAMLSAVGRLLGVAIENARLHEQVKAHHIEEQAVLLKLSQALLGEGEPQAMMDLTVRAAAEALRVDLAAVALVDPDGQSYSGQAFTGWPPEIFQQMQRIPLAASNGLGYALQTRKPVVVADESRETRFGAPPFVTQAGIISSLLAPMMAGEKAIGGLVVNSRAQRDWSADEVRLLSLIANDTAQALERARLFESLAAEKQRLELLYHLSQSLAASLDAREVAVRALALTTAALGAFKGQMLVLEPGSDRLHLVAMSGYEAESVEALDRKLNLRVGQGMAGSAALTRAPHLAPDVARDEHWVSVPGVDDWAHSAAAIPLLAGDELVGVLNLLSDREGFFHAEDLPLLTAVTVPIALALQNARLFEESGRRVQELALLYDAGLTLNRVMEPRAQLEFLLKLAATALRADAAEFFVFDPARDELRYEFGIGLSAEEAEGLRRLRFAAADEATVPGWVATNRLLLNLPDARADRRWVVTDPAFHSALFVPVAYEEQLRGILGVKSKSGDAFTPQDERLLTLFANQVSVAMNNARLFEETRRRTEELEALSQVSATLRKAQTREAMLPLLVETTMRLLNADSGALLLVDTQVETQQAVETQDAASLLTFAAARGPAEALLGRQHPLDDDPLWQVVRSGEPIFIPDVAEQGEFARWEVCRALMAGMTACACVPLKTAEATVGLLHLAFRSKRALTEGEIRLLNSIAEMAGSAIHRTALHDETEHRLRLVEALRNIDMAITASLDVRVTLSVFLDQAMAQLRVDAAAVLLLNPHTQFLEYAAGRGFRSTTVERSRLRLGEGYAGRAALERRAFHVPDLSRAEDYLRASLLRGEDFVGYYVTPLIVKGHVQGVFEMLHRAPLHLSPMWLSFLEALAAQASIAIDNAGLYDDLQRSNVELALAYDTTLEGWARALELRDQETEGHTRRVTEMTERLARAMGINGESLVHIRRGALLHDIGKMGIPDSILLKPGPLADEEWVIMRRHPVYAYRMLSPIRYLGPALDIPYCHHEKWEGTGYPRGLKGEQIPAAARIFAVADVWDALRSDRPYRKGWPEERVREYIREQAGKHFDPRVVEAFLEMYAAKAL